MLSRNYRNFLHSLLCEIELLFYLFTVDELCYKDWNYLESSRRSMSRNVLFQEFSRTVTHQFQNSLWLVSLKIEFIVIAVNSYFWKLLDSLRILLVRWLLLLWLPQNIMIISKYQILGWPYQNISVKSLMIYSYFEKGCRKKCTRQSWRVLWVILSALFFKEI